MQAWHVHQYDPVWYETEYVSPSEVKILVESELLKRLKKIHFASTFDTSFWSYKNYLTSMAIKKTMKEYTSNRPNFGTFQDFDNTIYYELVDDLLCNYILISRNYRIIKRELKDQADQYGLFEVMYNDEGEIFGHSETPELVGESPKDLLDALELMIHDVNEHIINGKEVLELGKIKFAKPCEDYDEGEEVTLEELDDMLKD